MEVPSKSSARAAASSWIVALLVTAVPLVARGQEGATVVSEPVPSSRPGVAAEASGAGSPPTAADTASSAAIPSETPPGPTPQAQTPHFSGPAPDVSKELKRPIYKKMSLSIGSPHNGRQMRAKKLHGDAVLHLLKKGSDKVFGHPALVLMLHRSAKQVAKAFPGSRLVVGDLSAEAGGPLEGHHSHQSGRDADVLFYARDADGKEVLPKKFVQYDANGKATDGSGLTFDDERNWALVESWANDKRAGIHYIFVARWLRQRLLSFALKHPKHKDHLQEVAGLFLQPEGAEPHDDHFHVRIRCPTGEEKICVE